MNRKEKQWIALVQAAYLKDLHENALPPFLLYADQLEIQAAQRESGRPPSVPPSNYSQPMHKPTLHDLNLVRWLVEIDPQKSRAQSCRTAIASICGFQQTRLSDIESTITKKGPGLLSRVFRQSPVRPGKSPELHVDPALTAAIEKLLISPLFLVLEEFKYFLVVLATIEFQDPARLSRLRRRIKYLTTLLTTSEQLLDDKPLCALLKDLIALFNHETACCECAVQASQLDRSFASLEHHIKAVLSNCVLFLFLVFCDSQPRKPIEGLDSLRQTLQSLSASQSRRGHSRGQSMESISIASIAAVPKLTVAAQCLSALINHQLFLMALPSEVRVQIESDGGDSSDEEGGERAGDEEDSNPFISQHGEAVIPNSISETILSDSSQSTGGALIPPSSSHRRSSTSVSRQSEGRQSEGEAPITVLHGSSKQPSGIFRWFLNDRHTPLLKELMLLHGHLFELARSLLCFPYARQVLAERKSESLYQQLVNEKGKIQSLPALELLRLIRVQQAALWAVSSSLSVLTRGADVALQRAERAITLSQKNPRLLSTKVLITKNVSTTRDLSSTPESMSKSSVGVEEKEKKESEKFSDVLDLKDPAFWVWRENCKTATVIASSMDHHIAQAFSENQIILTSLEEALKGEAKRSIDDRKAPTRKDADSKTDETLDHNKALAFHIRGLCRVAPLYLPALRGVAIVTVSSHEGKTAPVEEQSQLARPRSNSDSHDGDEDEEEEETKALVKSDIVRTPEELQSQAKALSTKAESCLSKGKVPKAIALWTTAIERYPDEEEYAFRIAKATATWKPTVIDLARSRLAPGEMEPLVELLSKYPIKRLQLGLNSIGPVGAEILLAGVKTCTTVQELYLYKNRIMDQGVVTLAKVLKTHPGLKKVDISDNQITSKGIEALCSVFSTNTTLTYLDVSHNALNSDGVYLLAKKLVAHRTTTKLEKLLIEMTNFGETCHNCLLELAKEVDSLTELYIGRQQIALPNNLRAKLAQTLRSKSSGARSAVLNRQFSLTRGLKEKAKKIKNLKIRTKLPSSKRTRTASPTSSGTSGGTAGSQATSGGSPASTPKSSVTSPATEEKKKTKAIPTRVAPGPSAGYYESASKGITARAAMVTHQDSELKFLMEGFAKDLKKPFPAQFSQHRAQILEKESKAQKEELSAKLEKDEEDDEEDDEDDEEDKKRESETKKMNPLEVRFNIWNWVSEINQATAPPPAIPLDTLSTPSATSTTKFQDTHPILTELHAQWLKERQDFALRLIREILQFQRKQLHFLLHSLAPNLYQKTTPPSSPWEIVSPSTDKFVQSPLSDSGFAEPDKDMRKRDRRTENFVIQIGEGLGSKTPSKNTSIAQVHLTSKILQINRITAKGKQIRNQFELETCEMRKSEQCANKLYLKFHAHKPVPGRGRVSISSAEELALFFQPAEDRERFWTLVFPVTLNGTQGVPEKDVSLLGVVKKVGGEVTKFKEKLESVPKLLSKEGKEKEGKEREKESREKERAERTQYLPEEVMRDTAEVERLAQQKAADTTRLQQQAKNAALDALFKLASTVFFEELKTYIAHEFVSGEIDEKFLRQFSARVEYLANITEGNRAAFPMSRTAAQLGVLIEAGSASTKHSAASDAEDIFDPGFLEFLTFLRQEFSRYQAILTREVWLTRFLQKLSPLIDETRVYTFHSLLFLLTALRTEDASDAGTEVFAKMFSGDVDSEEIGAKGTWSGELMSRVIRCPFMSVLVPTFAHLFSPATSTNARPTEVAALTSLKDPNPCLSAQGKPIYISYSSSNSLSPVGRNEVLPLPVSRSISSAASIASAEEDKEEKEYTIAQLTGYPIERLGIVHQLNKHKELVDKFLQLHGAIIEIARISLFLDQTVNRSPNVLYLVSETAGQQLLKALFKVYVEAANWFADTLQSFGNALLPFRPTDPEPAADDPLDRSMSVSRKEEKSRLEKPRLSIFSFSSSTKNEEKSESYSESEEQFLKRQETTRWLRNLDFAINFWPKIKRDITRCVKEAQNLGSRFERMLEADDALEHFEGYEEFVMRTAKVSQMVNFHLPKERQTDFSSFPFVKSQIEKLEAELTGKGENWTGTGGSDSDAKTSKAELQAQNKAKAQQYAAQAQEFARNSQVEAAIRTYVHAIRLDPAEPSYRKGIAAAAKLRKTLPSLQFTDSKLTDKEVNNVVQQIYDNSETLLTIKLDNNQLTAQGCTELLKALDMCRQLTDLDLSKNKLGDDGAEAVALALNHHPNLTRLALDGNGIGPKGAQKLADALIGHQKLKRLLLRSNPLFDEGVKAIAKAFKDNWRNQLEELDISETNISDDSGDLLLKAIRWSVNLRSVSIENNKRLTKLIVGDVERVGKRKQALHKLIMDAKKSDYRNLQQKIAEKPLMSYYQDCYSALEKVQMMKVDKEKEKRAKLRTPPGLITLYLHLQCFPLMVSKLWESFDQDEGEIEQVYLGFSLLLQLLVQFVENERDRFAVQEMTQSATRSLELETVCWEWLLMLGDACDTLRGIVFQNIQDAMILAKDEPEVLSKTLRIIEKEEALSPATVHDRGGSVSPTTGTSKEKEKDEDDVEATETKLPTSPSFSIASERVRFPILDSLSAAREHLKLPLPSASDFASKAEGIKARIFGVLEQGIEDRFQEALKPMDELVKRISIVVPEKKLYAKEGYLEKKSGTNRHRWQKRYFVIDTFTHQVLYFATESEKGGEEKGSFSLKDIASVTIRQTGKGSRDGLRFDVKMNTQSRVYSMVADTKESASEWVTTLAKYSAISRQDRSQATAVKAPTPTPTPTPALFSDEKDKDKDGKDKDGKDKDGKEKSKKEKEKEQGPPLVQFLNILRDLAEDLDDVANYLIPCFPTSYRILRYYSSRYHNRIMKALQALPPLDNLNLGDLLLIITWLQWYDERFTKRNQLEKEKQSGAMSLEIQGREDEIMEIYARKSKARIMTWVEKILSLDKLDNYKLDTEGHPYTDAPHDLFSNLSNVVGVLEQQRLRGYALYKAAVMCVGVLSFYQQALDGFLTKVKCIPLNSLLAEVQAELKAQEQGTVEAAATSGDGGLKPSRAKWSVRALQRAAVGAVGAAVTSGGKKVVGGVKAGGKAVVGGIASGGKAVITGFVSLPGKIRQTVSAKGGKESGKDAKDPRERAGPSESVAPDPTTMSYKWLCAQINNAEIYEKLSENLTHSFLKQISEPQHAEKLNEKLETLTEQFLDFGNKAITAIADAIWLALKPTWSQFFTPPWFKARSSITDGLLDQVDAILQLLHADIKKKSFFGQLVKRVLAKITTGYCVLFSQTAVTTKQYPNLATLIQEDRKQFVEYFSDFKDWIDDKTVAWHCERLNLITSLFQTDDGFQSAHFKDLAIKFEAAAESVLSGTLDKNPALGPERKKELLTEFQKKQFSDEAGPKKREGERRGPLEAEADKCLIC